MLTVEETLDHLANAAGGHSQFPDHLVGFCLAGQHNNATPWPFRPGLFRERLEEAAQLILDRWELPEELLPSILLEIERGYVLNVLELDRPELLSDWSDEPIPF